MVSSLMCNIIRPTAGLWRKGHVLCNLCFSRSPNAVCRDVGRAAENKRRNTQPTHTHFMFLPFYFSTPPNFYPMSTHDLYAKTPTPARTKGPLKQNGPSRLGPDYVRKTNNHTHARTDTHGLITRLQSSDRQKRTDGKAFKHQS